ncbi:hypothetical protein [Streptomyces sp. NPDC087300]|uniref:hypothetical protein n=1 Tax=Streptomyces sp. NPDC087300 TaxID=3365780 RepID=UPI00380C599E
MSAFPARLPEVHRTARGHAFYPPASVLAKIPALYATENIETRDKRVHLHYFATWGDIYVTEIDPQTMEAYGFGMVGHSDPAHGDWGYFDLPAFESQTPTRPGSWLMERDLHFKTGRAADVLPDGAL